MILVTGGTGFLGSAVIKRLVEKGNAVIALKRNNSTIPESLRASSLIEWIDADITDYFALSDVFDRVTQVYHCAAKISYQKEDAEQMFRVNVEGTQHIVNLSLEHGVRLLHVSSIAALGSNKLGKPVDEIDKWEYDINMSNYSLSKYKSELEVWRGITEGLEAVIVNPSVIMGVNSAKSGSAVIFDIVQKGIKIYPPGSVGLVDVEDVAEIMILLMERNDITAQRYVLNSDNISNKQLLSDIASLLGKKAPTIAAKPFMLQLAWRIAKLIAKIKGKRPSLTKESAYAAAAKLSYSNTKIVSELGYHFKPIHQTLQEIANTYS
ncbi:SDR family NAD(P)-dependent oxidoreductase [Sphingobacterium faecale]|uniref:SDR family NAD(P)-dependent oxidoreductase n=1 Tax=Sphingobacterium faecale TaxID=2803775 RepID=A0ABS1R899_9SPHI|nr:SDR family NAD(P)-dependent oxidoreductase [Sphingobacterium faecale]MBL1410745.1 SDR family NAD(P)-dependent oxidoreductase [Sphingobacterium faecale]